MLFDLDIPLELYLKYSSNSFIKESLMMQKMLFPPILTYPLLTVPYKAPQSDQLMALKFQFYI